MSPDSTFVSKEFSDLIELIKNIAGIIIGGGGIIGLIISFFTKFLPWYRIKRDNRSLDKRFGAELYSKGIIEQSTRYYIEPNCQSVDPAGEEEPRLVYGAKEKLFSAIDNALFDPTAYRYLILLADSGMGKTSFMLNYYTRNLRKRKQLNLELLPLGIPDIAKRIKNIPDKKDKILFLDALDEDTLAIKDHVNRLKTLMEFTQDFRKILITCRTQFFPKDEEIPRETGIIKIGPTSAGEPAQYLFHKLYLSPFSDQQVERYLKKRYSLFHFTQRKKAKELVKKIPQLTVRPMLLAHIKDLVASNRQFDYSFQLYEEMVEAWLMREDGKLGIKKEPLRHFSELLAIDLYSKREWRHAERIPKEELIALAKEYHIPLDDWQLTGRSLLNRDAVGNFKFAHRTIMEYLFVLKFLKTKPTERIETIWTDQMKRFLLEILLHLKRNSLKIPSLLRVDLNGILRFKLRNKEKPLSSDHVTQLIKKHDFFDKNKNQTGKGLEHFYLNQKENNENLIIDLTTGLVWQQSGSSNFMTYEDAKKYIDKLNLDDFAGHKDWRLPTLEEAMSLMEREKKNGDLYIDPMFDKTQRWIWTSDLVARGSAAWVVSFYYGECYDDDLGISIGHCVRAVRSGHSSP